jgi:glycosyltransferase involved in cell wall biosynthesis
VPECKKSGSGINMNNPIHSYRVCHITSAHSRYDVRILLKECVSARNSGYDVQLIVADGKGDEIREGIEIFDIGKATSRLNRMLLTTYKIFKTALRIEADMYHFHDPEFLFYAFLLKTKGFKVIYDVHEDLPMQLLTKPYIPFFLRNAANLIISFIEKSISRYLSGIITATPIIKSKFTKHKMIKCVANYPLLEEFVCFKSTTTIHKNKCVCYIGGIWKERGIYEMVNAIAQTDALLLLAGTFDSSHEHEEVRNFDGWNKVNELGNLDRNGIVSVLQRSLAGLVLLHPKRNYMDSLPVKMFEYMAAGIPVIASNFPLWREIIMTNNCGICVDPLDTKAIAHAIQLVIHDNNKAMEMGINGRRAVENKYNWTNESQNMLDLYGTILNSIRMRG